MIVFGSSTVERKWKLRFHWPGRRLQEYVEEIVNSFLKLIDFKLGGL